MKYAWTLILLAFLAACTPTAKAPSVSSEEALGEIRLQKQFAVQARMEQLKRLYDVGLPIMAANAPLCGDKVWPHHGMMLESLSSVDDKLKDAMRIFYGIENQLTVAYIGEGSPASGKIQPGDRILRVNGVSIPSGTKGKKVFLETIWEEGRDVTLPVTLTVERGRHAKREDVVIHPVPGCASFITMEMEDEVNAYANGTAIVFTTGMMRYAAKDNELAMIFAHELAHNARLHIESKIINRFLGEMIAVIIQAGTGVNFSDLLSDLGAKAFSQGFEAEADYVGLYMMARAGYKMDNAMDIFRRFGATNPESIHIDQDASHPSTALRFVAMKKTLAEIREKQAKGLPLIPEEKTGEDTMRDLEKTN